MIIMIIFNMSMSYFHNISFHYFEDYLMMKLIPPNFDNFGAFFHKNPLYGLHWIFNVLVGKW
jgi:hypothetical protein